MSDASVPSGFSERDFYLREFRGRTLAIAVAAADAEGGATRVLERTLETLEGGGARVLLVSDAPEWLEEVCAGRVLGSAAPRLEGEVWRALRRRPRLGVATPDAVDFAGRCRELALRLGLFKLVWIDPEGGMRRDREQRYSFVHLDELRSQLAEGAPPRPRASLWREIVAMLEAGVPAVNVCSLSDLEAELFTYAGCGTLFTRDRYVSVRRFGIDDFDAAHDLMGRGVREGFLAPRSEAEADRVLASGFGAFIEGRYLAGIGALLHPGGDVGEIAGLYTLTRFQGEGVGQNLVAFALDQARLEGLGSVVACTTSEAAGAFFERQGFDPCSPDALPPQKWKRYDPARKSRLRCYRKAVR